MVHRAVPGGGQQGAGPGRRRGGFVPPGEEVRQPVQGIPGVAGARHGQHVGAADHFRLEPGRPQRGSPRPADAQQNLAVVIAVKVPAFGPEAQYRRMAPLPGRGGETVEALPPGGEGGGAFGSQPAGAAVQADEQRIAGGAGLEDIQLPFHGGGGR